MRRKPSEQSGFALLFVLLMAAMISFVLYRAMPRVAFESQRNQEELLIERGEQYARGIQLYVRKFGTYPDTMEKLEKTNNVRFLRRRYKDPITGKDEWRIIHAGAGGIFTDSLTQKPPATTDKDKAAQDAGTQGTPVADLAAQQAQGGQIKALTLAMRRRASEMGTAAPAGPDAASGGTDPNAPPPGQENQEGAEPVPPGENPDQTATAPQGGATAPPIIAPPGSTGNPQTGTQTPTPGAPTPGAPNPAAPAGNPALALIQNQLTHPSAPPVGVTGGAPGGQVIGAGIAGVASKSEREGIKVYNKRKKYNEWEFLYDPKKDVGAAAATGAGGQGYNVPNTSGQGLTPMTTGPTPNPGPGSNSQM